MSSESGSEANKCEIYNFENLVELWNKLKFNISNIPINELSFKKYIFLLISKHIEETFKVLKATQWRYDYLKTAQQWFDEITILFKSNIKIQSCAYNMILPKLYDNISNYLNASDPRFFTMIFDLIYSCVVNNQMYNKFIEDKLWPKILKIFISSNDIKIQVIFIQQLIKIYSNYYNKAILLRKVDQIFTSKDNLIQISYIFKSILDYKRFNLIERFLISFNVNNISFSCKEIKVNNNIISPIDDCNELKLHFNPILKKISLFCSKASLKGHLYVLNPFIKTNFGIINIQYSDITNIEFLKKDFTNQTNDFKISLKLKNSCISSFDIVAINKNDFIKMKNIFNNVSEVFQNTEEYSLILTSDALDATRPLVAPTSTENNNQSSRPNSEISDTNSLIIIPATNDYETLSASHSVPNSLTESQSDIKKTPAKNKIDILKLRLESSNGTPKIIDTIPTTPPLREFNSDDYYSVEESPFLETETSLNETTNAAPTTPNKKQKPAAKKVTQRRRSSCRPKTPDFKNESSASSQQKPKKRKRRSKSVPIEDNEDDDFLIDYGGFNSVTRTKTRTVRPNSRLINEMLYYSDANVKEHVDKKLSSLESTPQKRCKYIAPIRDRTIERTASQSPNSIYKQIMSSQESEYRNQNKLKKSKIFQKHSQDSSQKSQRKLLTNTPKICLEEEPEPQSFSIPLNLSFNDDELTLKTSTTPNISPKPQKQQQQLQQLTDDIFDRLKLNNTEITLKPITANGSQNNFEMAKSMSTLSLSSIDEEIRDLQNKSVKRKCNFKESPEANKRISITDIDNDMETSDIESSQTDELVLLLRCITEISTKFYLANRPLILLLYKIVTCYLEADDPDDPSKKKQTRKLLLSKLKQVNTKQPPNRKSK